MLLLFSVSTKFIQDIVSNAAVQSAQPNLAMEDIRTFPCFVLTNDELETLTRYLDRKVIKIDKLVKKVEAAIDPLRESHSALTTAAVTGKVAVREPKTVTGVRHASAALP